MGWLRLLSRRSNTALPGVLPSRVSTCTQPATPRRAGERDSGKRARVDAPRWAVAVALLALAVAAALGDSPALASSHCSTQASQALIDDCETLLGLKSDLAGTSNKLDNWAGTSAITGWTGVTSDSSNGVTELWIRGDQGTGTKLNGTIPAALGDLSGLTILELSHNELTGSIPKELGSLENLKTLALHGNKLSGRIPTELGQLSVLQELGLDQTGGLEGPIPTELGNLPKLNLLYLSGNKLTGGIPRVLGSLSNLALLQAGNNQLSGPIPRELGNLSNLTNLDLRGNRLSGGIPGELGSLSSLTYLYLQDNRLSGPIPTELGNLSNLTILQLDQNELSGPIPSQLGSLSNLTRLLLYENKLTGDLPDELGNLSNLQWLLLHNNRLTGPIPSWLGSLGSLVLLTLHQNRLTGGIPSELGNLSSLLWLYLGDNPLDDGTIPTWLSSLTSLQRLALHESNRTGSIPTALSSLTRLQQLHLHENKLESGIPTWLGSLTSLQQLSLHRNPLGGSIPTELGSLSSLTHLLLDKAELTGAIPATLGSLSKLQELGLSCNELSGTVPAALGNAGSGVTGEDADGNPLKTQIFLQTNTLVDAANSPLRRTAQLPASLRSPADGGSKRTSPELEVTLTGRCRGDSPAPAPASRKSKPRPPPPPPRIGVTDAARAVLPPGSAVVRLERLDMPGQVLEVAIGSVSADRQTVVPRGVIRDVAEGQTYIVVRLEPAESDGRVRRLWVPPDSPWVAQIVWPEVSANFSVPTAVLAAIPLYGLPTVPGQALRRVDPNDPRIYSWDGETHQWRHVPDVATFQALGLFWCDITVADPEFFTRLPDVHFGPPYPATTRPERTDYPTCRAA